MGKGTYDVMILGAGVAGATAGALLANRGLRVVLVERDRHQRRRQPRPDWITRPALAMLDTLQVSAPKLLSSPLTGGTFHSADLSKSTETLEEPPPAFRVDYAEWVRRIIDRAAEAGAHLVSGRAPADLVPGEDEVMASFKQHEPVRARFLLLADGVKGRPGAHAPKGARWIAQLCSSAARFRTDNHMHWVLGLDTGRSLVAWWFDQKRVVVHCWAEGSDESVRTRLQTFLPRAHERGLLPARVVADERRITLRPTPAVSALEMDSHVGKRTLKIGDAGGFVAAGSREGIYPAMWSASLAAEVLLDAADSKQPQDVLQGFSARWRTTMAEYLGTSDIDTPFLIPLVFSNQQMARRMASAFWRSEKP
jgi:flavin-dependent dehydrogenase